MKSSTELEEHVSFCKLYVFNCKDGPSQTSEDLLASAAEANRRRTTTIIRVKWSPCCPMDAWALRCMVPSGLRTLMELRTEQRASLLGTRTLRTGLLALLLGARSTVWLLPFRRKDWRTLRNRLQDLRPANLYPDLPSQECCVIFVL